LVDKAHTYIKDTWNQMYASYLGKENVSDVASKYFDNSVDINNIDLYYNQSFSKLIGKNEVDFKMLEVVNGSSSSLVLTDELIQVNFGYKLAWTHDYSSILTDELREMTRYSKIILKYDGASFKIYDVLDTKSFSYNSHYTEEY
jgi:hypothetical protein